MRSGTVIRVYDFPGYKKQTLDCSTGIGAGRESLANRASSTIARPCEECRISYLLL